MNYQQKLLDPRWQKKRLEIFQRDNWSCVQCGSSTRTLHVHHEMYSGEPWDISDDKLKTLCELCHFNKHPAPIATLVELESTRLQLIDKLSAPNVSAYASNTWRQAISIIEKEAMANYQIDLTTLKKFG